MNIAIRTVHAVAVGLLLAPAGLSAAEPTEHELLYQQLKESEEPGAEPLAERWHPLIRQRLWTDASGKYKVYARYVDHAADFKSVTLLILQKKGNQQSYKQTVIPLAKLGKSEQALVKRIAQVRKDVEAKLAAAPADGGASDSGYGESGEDAPRRVGRPGYGPPDESMDEPIEEPPPTAPVDDPAAASVDPPADEPPGARYGPVGRPPQEEPMEEAPPQSYGPVGRPPESVADEPPPQSYGPVGRPPEAGVEEAPSASYGPVGRPPESMEETPQFSYGPVGRPPSSDSPSGPPAVVTGSEPWRQDFTTFAANLSAAPDAAGESAASWGELAALQSVYEQERMLATLRKLPAAQRPQQALLFQQAAACGWSRAALGAVTWEVTLGAPIAGPGAKIEHDLAVPEPFAITLIADAAERSAYSKLQAGDRVRLKGFFTSLGGDKPKPEITLRVKPVE